jgi:hypothetical protein
MTTAEMSTINSVMDSIRVDMKFAIALNKNKILIKKVQNVIKCQKKK